MAPCLRLLKSIFPQPDTTEQQEKEKWENLLTALKENKLTLTETRVDTRYARSTSKTQRTPWSLTDVKVNSESNNRVYGVGMIKRRNTPRFDAAPDEEYAQFHLELIQSTKTKRPGFRARFVIVTAKRTIQLESNWRPDGGCGSNCREYPLTGTSIESTNTTRSGSSGNDVPDSLVQVLYIVDLATADVEYAVNNAQTNVADAKTEVADAEAAGYTEADFEAAAEADGFTEAEIDSAEAAVSSAQDTLCGASDGSC